MCCYIPAALSFFYVQQVLDYRNRMLCFQFWKKNAPNNDRNNDTRSFKYLIWMLRCWLHMVASCCAHLCRLSQQCGPMLYKIRGFSAWHEIRTFLSTESLRDGKGKQIENAYFFCAGEFIVILYVIAYCYWIRMNGLNKMWVKMMIYGHSRLNQVIDWK